MAREGVGLRVSHLVAGSVVADRPQASSSNVSATPTCLAWRSSPPRQPKVAALGPDPGHTPRRCRSAFASTASHRGKRTFRRRTERIQERSGADWFRLDIFLSKVAPPRINEISYPSRSGEDPRAWVRLLCAYRQGRFRAVAGKKIWRQVAAAASLPPTARLAPNQSVPRSRSRSSSELSTDHVGAEDRALFRVAKDALSRVY